jgi:hypothetical protein
LIYEEIFISNLLFFFGIKSILIYFVFTKEIFLLNDYLIEQKYYFNHSKIFDNRGVINRSNIKLPDPTLFFFNLLLTTVPVELYQQYI